jgi:hypothetical protein
LARYLHLFEYSPGPFGSEGDKTVAIIPTYTCICGIQKKSTNHWVLAKVTPFGIGFMPWDWNMARSKDIVILCGEGCAAALLSRSLGEWKHAAPTDTAIEPELAVV